MFGKILAEFASGFHASLPRITLSSFLDCQIALVALAWPSHEHHELAARLLDPLYISMCGILSCRSRRACELRFSRPPNRRAQALDQVGRRLGPIAVEALG